MESTTKLACILALVSATSACTVVPTYTLPQGTQEKAFLKFRFEEENRKPIGQTARVDYYPTGICGNAPAAQKVFIKSQGNPMISDLNPNGVLIPAGAKFVFAALSTRTNPGCGRIASFTPKPNRAYELLLRQPWVPQTPTNMPEAGQKLCTVEVLDLGDMSHPSSSGSPVADLEYVRCPPQKK